MSTMSLTTCLLNDIFSSLPVRPDYKEEQCTDVPLLFSFQAFLPLPSIRPCNVSRPAGLITRIILLFFPGFVQFSSPIGPIRQKDHRETCKVFAGFKVNFSFVPSNTPACAGKTQSCYCRAAWSRAHPRLRGEDVCRRSSRHRRVGSPPLARGRPVFGQENNIKIRLTPACAGKTRTLRAMYQTV